MDNKRTIQAPHGLHLREAEGEKESRTIEGYALKFGELSVILGYYQPMREILEPGCITREMLDAQTIYFTMYHDRQIILGRWTGNPERDTLKLKLDEVGLKVECEMPHTTDGETALELVRRGDLSGMSFVYSTSEDDETAVSYEKTDEVTEWGAEVALRHVHRIENMYDVTIAASPAYEQTEITAREQKAREALTAEEPETTIQADAKMDAAAKREKVDRLRRLAETTIMD